MAGSGVTFSSALSYALERLGTPNLILKEEQRKSVEVCSYGYRQDLARAFATKISHS